MERPPLVRPEHRHRGHPRGVEAEGKASFKSSFDEFGRKESERERHAEGAGAPVFARGDHFNRLTWIGNKFVQPSPGIEYGNLEMRRRIDAHRSRRLFGGFRRKNDLSLSPCWRWRKGNVSVWSSPSSRQTSFNMISILDAWTVARSIMA